MTRPVCQKSQDIDRMEYILMGAKLDMGLSRGGAYHEGNQGDILEY